MTLEPGLRGGASLTVTDADTAQAIGSGDVPVLATPRLIALAEAATVSAVVRHLGQGESSVGTRVRVDHLKASPVGVTVHVDAELVEVDGRKLRFEIAATDDTGDLVGRGEITRAVVDREKFLAR